MRQSRSRPAAPAILPEPTGSSLVGLLAAGEANAALRHFDGAVLSKNRAETTFRLNTQSGRVVKFRVNATTKFERLPGGFSGLQRGLVVQVDAKRTNRGLLARLVETRKGSGGSGGHGADNGPNHG